MIYITFHEHFYIGIFYRLFKQSEKLSPLYHLHNFYRMNKDFVSLMMMEEKCRREIVFLFLELLNPACFSLFILYDCGTR